MNSIYKFSSKINFSIRERLLLFLLFCFFFLALIRISYINRENLKFSHNEEVKIQLQYDTFSTLDIKAKNVYIYNFTKQEEIYGKRQDEKKYIASITKLMTSIVSDYYADSKLTLHLEDFIFLEKNYVEVGQILDKDILEKVMLVSSSNNLANSFKNNLNLSKGVDLIFEMNKRSKQLGLSNTNFINETGLDETNNFDTLGNISSAKDVLNLTYFSFRKIPNIVRATSKKDFIFKNYKKEDILVENTNQYVKNIPNLILSKTGYTEMAGGTLTILFLSDYNKDLIGITLLDSTRESRFLDMEKLVKRVEIYLELLDNYTII
jgi:D-alanyl-D-alanine carboxypeptidase (penicillin-binding protein 5/6)